MEHVILNEETGAKISIYYHESKQMLPMVVICPGEDICGCRTGNKGQWQKRFSNRDFRRLLWNIMYRDRI